MEEKQSAWPAFWGRVRWLLILLAVLLGISVALTLVSLIIKAVVR